MALAQLPNVLDVTRSEAGSEGRQAALSQRHVGGRSHPGCPTRADCADT